MPAANLVILNPAAGKGARFFRRLEGRIRASLGEVEFARTRAPLDARRIAREAVRAGVSRLVVAGGDGTLGEVATGLLAAGLGKEAEIACLPLGLGCDFSRSFEIPRAVEGAIECLGTGRSRRVDACRIHYRGHGGIEETRFYLNEASFGLSGVAVEAVRRSRSSLGPRAAYTFAGLRAILHHPTPEVVVRVDGAPVYEGRISLVVAANGRFFGGGMRVAPDAQLDDGQLDIVIVRALSRLDLLMNFPSLQRGDFVDHPAVSIHRGSHVEALVHGDSRALLDVDGEAPGGLPLRIELMPRAIGIFGLPEPAPQNVAGSEAELRPMRAEN